MQAAVLTLALAAGQPDLPPPGQPVEAQARRQPHPPLFVIPFLWMVLLPALVAANQAQEQAAEEDESMPADAPGAEFKIVRSVAGFRTPAQRAEVLAEEAAAGWELFEVIDERRMRLRRATSWRATDPDRPGDPYRTQVGPGVGAQVRKSLLIVFGVLVALLAIGVGIAVAVK